MPSTNSSPVLQGRFPAVLRDKLEQLVVAGRPSPAEEVDEAPIHERYLVGTLAPADLTLSQVESDECAVGDDHSPEDGICSPPGSWPPPPAAWSR